MKHTKLAVTGTCLYCLSFLISFFIAPFRITLLVATIVLLVAVSAFICDRKASKLLLTALLLTTLICTNMGLISLYGTMHGMYDWEKSVANTIYSIRHSPNTYRMDQTVTEDYKGMLIILYRFGCKDCEAIYNDLIQSIQESDIDVYWLSSRSAEGQAFLKQYPVTYVPTGIYIPRNNTGNVTYIQKHLNKNGTFDETNWNRLLELKNHDV